MARNRERGAIVDILDGAKLEEAAWKVALANGANPEHRKFLSAEGTSNYLLNTQRGLAVVGTEGVGSWETPDGVNVHFSYFASHTTFVIPVKTVLAARSGKTADLADVIREFGDRLEVNFGIWRQEYVGRVK